MQSIPPSQTSVAVVDTILYTHPNKYNWGRKLEDRRRDSTVFLQLLTLVFFAFLEISAQCKKKKKKEYITELAVTGSYSKQRQLNIS